MKGLWEINIFDVSQPKQSKRQAFVIIVPSKPRFLNTTIRTAVWDFENQR